MSLQTVRYQAVNCVINQATTRVWDLCKRQPWHAVWRAVPGQAYDRIFEWLREDMSDFAKHYAVIHGEEWW